MSEWMDSHSRGWAIAAVVAGVVLFASLELIEEPDLTPAQLLLELLSITPVVMTSVGVALLLRVTKRQRDHHLLVLRDLEVALLLLKGLSTKAIAAVRAGSERTVREHARSIYSKAGLTGRSALSAFFLEDLLAPIEGLE